MLRPEPGFSRAVACRPVFRAAAVVLFHNSGHGEAQVFQRVVLYPRSFVAFIVVHNQEYAVFGESAVFNLS